MSGLESIIYPNFHHKTRIYGVVCGIVVDNEHPQGAHEVQVKLPWVKESDTRFTDDADDEDFILQWCPVATLMAGKEQRGSFFLPDVDDQVLVAFEHGQVSNAYVIGALHSKEDPPPHSNKDQEGKNQYRTIRDGSGNTIQMISKGQKDDGKLTQIVLQNDVPSKDCATDAMSRKGNRVILDHAEQKIRIYDTEKKNLIEIDTKGKIIKICATEGDVEICAEKEFRVKSNTVLMDIKDTYDTKTGGNFSLNCQAETNMKSSSDTIIKGANIKLN